MKQLLYIVPMLLLLSCNKSHKPEVAKNTLPMTAAKADFLPLQENKSHLDSLFKYATEEEISIYVKLKGEKELRQVTAKHIPDNVEATYNLFRDNMGHVVRIAESPYSDNEESFISCTHYFDEAGKTFAFERQINSFNCYCTDGVLFETAILYYDTRFKIIGDTYKLLDESGRHIEKDSCRLVEYQYRAEPDVAAYIRNKKLHVK